MSERPRRTAPVFVEIESLVGAPPETVWEVLADIRNWPSWNPAVTEVLMDGELASGTEFRWKAEGMMIISRLQRVEAPQRLLWTGKTPGIRATHLWQLEEADGGTLLRTGESFEGLMARLLSRPLTRMLDKSLASMVQQLKTEAERRQANHE